MDVALRLGGERIFVWFVILLGLLFAGMLGFLVGEQPIVTAIIIAATVGMVAWIALARRRWWLLMFAAGSFGGYFYFGYKLYPHEAALIACFIPLSLAVAVRIPGTTQKRSAFPLVMYVLGLYLLAHWAGSYLYNRAQGDSGFGNVTRAYFNAAWVVVFLFAFWRYGSTKFVRTALWITYVAAFGRLAIGLLTYYSSAFAYIPVVNYVLPGSTHTRAADLRASALAFGILAACYFLLHKGFVRKSFHGALFLASFAALLFGAGRGVLVLLCLVPIFVALIYQKIVPLFLSIVAVVGVVSVVNVNPTILDDLPYSVQRSVSVVLLDKGLADSYGRTSTSDIWHERLREIGYKKWTQNWNTFLFGTGIRPYDLGTADTGVDFEDAMESAAKVGAYEAGWWSVIAVTGLVGLILYLIVLFYLLRKLLPILLREKIRDARHAFAFMGVYSILVWLVLGWAQGGFPSTELLYSFVAVFAFSDAKKANPIRAQEPVLRPTPLAHSRRTLQPLRQ